MRNPDLQWIDNELYQWAKWAKKNGTHLGYPSSSAEYRVQKLGLQGAAIQQTNSNAMSIYTPDNVAKTEAEILKLSNQKLQDVVKTKYLQSGTDESRIILLSTEWGENLSMSTYRRMLERAMYWLSGALQNGEEAR